MEKTLGVGHAEEGRPPIFVCETQLVEDIVEDGDRRDFGRQREGEAATGATPGNPSINCNEHNRSQRNTERKQERENDKAH